MNPKYITIHCSATKPKNNFSIDKLRDLHVNQNGWSDIGYNFYITTDGQLHPCRPLNRSGAHVKGHNTGNVGICLEGGLNNDTGKPDDTYTASQMAALKDVVEYLQNSFCIDDENVKGHRDWGVNKACPCFEVKKWMENK
tara:strand:+ start:26760 stop:27179 length:420 start_codon:yes stop_codon:yes gene_type:complete